MNDERAKFDLDSYIYGKANETFINARLAYYKKLRGLNYKWWNNGGDSFKPYDFTIYWGNGEKRFDLECERKSSFYEKFFHPDFPDSCNNGLVNFVYKKVWKDRLDKCYYFMSIYDIKKRYTKYILYTDIVDIQKIGKKVRIPTKRDEYERLESFMQYPFNRCKIIYPIRRYHD